jgi:hypothetical protein
MRRFKPYWSPAKIDWVICRQENVPHELKDAFTGEQSDVASGNFPSSILVFNICAWILNPG